MTDACLAVIDYLFRELRLHRIEIQCASGNARSAAISRRLGFSFEGTRREAELVNGQFYDLLLFSLLRSEWRREPGDRSQKLEEFRIEKPTCWKSRQVHHFAEQFFILTSNS